MSQHNVKWLAQTTIYRDSLDLIAAVDWGDGRLHIGQPMQVLFMDQEAGVIIERPTLELKPDSARSLMQALWDAGIRPSEFQDASGEVRALKGHVQFAEHVAKQLLVGARAPKLTDAWCSSSPLPTCPGYPRRAGEPSCRFCGQDSHTFGKDYDE